jgi:hypothetical protein
LGRRAKPNAASTANMAPPTINSTPTVSVQARATAPHPTSIPRIVPLGVAIPVQADVFAPPPTCAPGITPPGVAIPAQADVFAPPPCAPGIVPPGPTFTTLLQALAFYVPPSEFTTST